MGCSTSKNQSARRTDGRLPRTTATRAIADATQSAAGREADRDARTLPQCEPTSGPSGMESDHTTASSEPSLFNCTSTKSNSSSPKPAAVESSPVSAQQSHPTPGGKDRPATALEGEAGQSSTTAQPEAAAASSSALCGGRTNTDLERSGGEEDSDKSSLGAVRSSVHDSRDCAGQQSPHSDKDETDAVTDSVKSSTNRDSARSVPDEPSAASEEVKTDPKLPPTASSSFDSPPPPSSGNKSDTISSRHSPSTMVRCHGLYACRISRSIYQLALEGRQSSRLKRPTLDMPRCRICQTPIPPSPLIVSPELSLPLTDQERQERRLEKQRGQELLEKYKKPAKSLKKRDSIWKTYVLPRLVKDEEERKVTQLLDGMTRTYLRPYLSFVFSLPENDN
ncbi:hypothetical protein ACOMHN_039654 [Nucella lapillus]